MAICYRLFITIVNIFFPPLAVIFLTGFGMDTLINAILFLAAILPSHVHAFYLSCVYFSRRRRVRKGRPPGGPKPFVYSENVLHGGARWDEVQELNRQQQQGGGLSLAGSGGKGGSAGFVGGCDDVEARRGVGMGMGSVGSMGRTRGPGVGVAGGGGSLGSRTGGGGGGGGGGYAGLRYGLGDADAAGWNASNGMVVGSGYGPGGPTDTYRGDVRRVRSAY
ncbi:plasma membrane proteolipid 3 [Diplodia corticola]|uniref:Plasma membrane proteolipid 3 n=1 Tax=Diplodia corticola TaxID=236234 RepID=A0A1J9S6P4_9PEZI|nr:plasma membrane proteolipid 3 [Diplodia corticola]OJD36191.1 plasma membrane proteolipid 3 [Diplodia corticola]